MTPLYPPGLKRYMWGYVSYVSRQPWGSAMLYVRAINLPGRAHSRRRLRKLSLRCLWCSCLRRAKGVEASAEHWPAGTELVHRRSLSVLARAPTRCCCLSGCPCLPLEIRAIPQCGLLMPSPLRPDYPWMNWKCGPVERGTNNREAFVLMLSTF